MREVRYAQNEANGVEDIRLAGAIESGDGVKVGVKVGDDRARGVGLEAVEDYLLNPHPVRLRPRRGPAKWSSRQKNYDLFRFFPDSRDESTPKADETSNDEEGYIRTFKTTPSS